ncbi:hypothetical protein SAMN05421538_101311 [Paracoccus isoporae]|uniref:Uncharacterized protein n=1 Tax=Paracoccus isoporae TaxID=591205 RepID=A0A1G6TL88_9RHOB|nr:hypothetical protein [Paracoccus isoporae]SDD29810.1 hypothetical protein SAMN05421538_101311 [Paracoccus isoporae]
MSRFADVTSDTPHGPRPVPEGHIPSDSIPPNRRLAPPRKGGPDWLIWGGVGVAAAATTALAVFAGRAVIDAVSGDDDDDDHRARRSRSRHAGPRRRYAPRFEALGAEDRQAMRSRARANFDDYDDHATETRKRARRQAQSRARSSQRSSGNFIDDLSDNANKVATSLTGILTAANAAVEGLQKVSGKTDGIMRDFESAADRLTGFLGSRSTDGSTDRGSRRHAAGDRDDAPRGREAAGRDDTGRDAEYRRVDGSKDRTHRL